MKWVTRERVKVDRVACPWLIKRFIDPQAEFLFVKPESLMQTAQKENAVPYDVPGVELGHHEGKCSFEALLAKYDLRDPAILMLSRIVHGADVKEDLYGCVEAPGLKAIAEGFQLLGLSDAEILQKQFPLYDALFAYCRANV
ncbi:MAG TPA: chromate resistance protein ChrB domain-containing protein [Acidobacteriota bacterium]